MDASQAEVCPGKLCIRAVKGLLTVFLNVFLEGAHNLFPLPGFEISGQAAQGEADHVAMMKLRPKIGLIAEAKPKVMEPVYIFRPEPRRVRTQVDVG